MSFSPPKFHPRAALMLKECGEDTFFIRTEFPKNAFASFPDVYAFEEYYKTIPQPQKNVYEFIHEKQPRRMYFDVEYMTEEEESDDQLQEILESLQRYFVEFFELDDIQWEIATSSGMHDSNTVQVKNSFHILLKGYYVRNHRAMRQIIDHMKTQVTCAGLDYAPYGKTQGLRMLGSSKRSKKASDLVRIKRPFEGSSDELQDHLISFLGSDEELPMVPFLSKINDKVASLPHRRGEKRKRSSEDSGCHSETDNEDIGTNVGHGYKFNFFKAEALLALLDSSFYDDYEKWINVGIALKQYGEECLLLFLEFSSQSSKYDKQACIEKWNTFPERPTISCKSLIYWARECNPRAVADLFAHVKTPIQCQFMQVKFGHDRLQKILEYVDDRATAERICVQFFHATVAFCLNNGNGIYMIKKGTNDFDSIDVVKYDRMIRRDLRPWYKYSAEEYVDNMLNSDSEQIAEPRVDLSKLHFRIQDRITFDKLIFDPGMKFSDSSLVINRFNGFKIIRDVERAHAEIDEWPLDHESGMYKIFNHCANVICGKESIAVKHFFFGWLNRLLNHPGPASGIALLLHSLPGCGKNVFTYFLKRVIGPEYTYETTENRLFVKFNGKLQHRILVVGNEVANGGMTKKRADLLKDMITCTEIDIELKGVNTITVPNYCNYVFTTNNDRPMQVDQGDRRMLILSLADTYVGNANYFSELVAAIEDDKAVTEFLTWLYWAYEPREWSPHDLPMTKLKQEMMMDSSPVVLKYVVNNKSFFQNMFLNMGNQIDYGIFDESFRRWTERYEVQRSRMYERTILNDLQQFLGVKIINRHKANKTISFVSLGYLDKQLKRYYGEDFVWE